MEFEADVTDDAERDMTLYEQLQQACKTVTGTASRFFQRHVIHSIASQQRAWHSMSTLLTEFGHLQEDNPRYKTAEGHSTWCRQDVVSYHVNGNMNDRQTTGNESCPR